MSNYCEQKACLGKPVHKSSNCPRAAKMERREIARKKRVAADSSYARCGECSGLVRVVKSDGVPVGFERHKMPSTSTWCKNGTQPVAKVRGSHKGKSVRTVSGGLPTLGNR